MADHQKERGERPSLAEIYLPTFYGWFRGRGPKENAALNICDWWDMPARALILAFKGMRMDKINPAEPPSALDFGVGIREDARFLLQNRFKVTGLSRSQAEDDHLVARMRAHDLQVRGVVAHAGNFQLDGKFDVVTSTLALNYLPKDEAERILVGLQNHTFEGGLNVITVLTTGNPPQGGVRLFKSGELHERYKDWEILQYTEFNTLPHAGRDRKFHRHAVAEIIARKPGDKAVVMGSFDLTRLTAGKSKQEMLLERQGKQLTLKFTSQDQILASTVTPRIVDILERIGIPFTGDRGLLFARKAASAEGTDTEVEVKARINGPYEQMMHAVAAAGGVYSGIEHQEILYLSHPTLPIRESGKTLRVRISNDRTILSYKGEPKEGKVKDRTEIESETDGNIARILASLGFQTDLTVTKRRENFALQGLTVSLDQVKELGPYIEIESHDPADKQRILDLLQRLGLLQEDIETRPYPLLLEERRK